MASIREFVKAAIEQQKIPEQKVMDLTSLRVVLGGPLMWVYPKNEEEALPLRQWQEEINASNKNPSKHLRTVRVKHQTSVLCNDTVTKVLLLTNVFPLSCVRLSESNTLGVEEWCLEVGFSGVLHDGPNECPVLSTMIIESVSFEFNLQSRTGTPADVTTSPPRFSFI